MELFTVGQVADILECEPSHIAQIGQIIMPEVPGRGKGHRSQYTFKNLVEVQIFRILSEFGVPRKRIREYIDNLAKLRFPWLDENNVGGWVGLDDKWGWSAGSTPNDTLEVMIHGHPVDGAIIINLAQLKRKLYERIEDIYVGRID